MPHRMRQDNEDWSKTNYANATIKVFDKSVFWFFGKYKMILKLHIWWTGVKGDHDDSEMARRELII